MTEAQSKQARTIKDYVVTYDGYELVVPKGSIVSNYTACGYDDNYRFWQDFLAIAEEQTGLKCSTLAEDLSYRGLNIPAEYCEPYEK